MNIFDRKALSLQDRHSNEQVCRRENWLNVQQITQEYQGFVMECVQLGQRSVSGQLFFHKRFSTETHTLKEQRQKKGQQIRKRH